MTNDCARPVANPAPLGLAGFAMTTILLNLHNAGFYGLSVMIMGMGIFFGGIAQLIAGIMEWRQGNTFGSLAFVSYGSFWLSLVFIWTGPVMGLPAADPVSMGFYLAVWGLFTFALSQGQNHRQTGLRLAGNPVLSAGPGELHRKPRHPYRCRVRGHPLRQLRPV